MPEAAKYQSLLRLPADAHCTRKGVTGLIIFRLFSVSSRVDKRIFYKMRIVSASLYLFVFERRISVQQLSFQPACQPVFRQSSAHFYGRLSGDIIEGCAVHINSNYCRRATTAHPLVATNDKAKLAVSTANITEHCDRPHSSCCSQRPEMLSASHHLTTLSSVEANPINSRRITRQLNNAQDCIRAGNVHKPSGHVCKILCVCHWRPLCLSYSFQL